MQKAAATIYIFWSLILIITGIYVVRKITDTSNPSSLASSLKTMKETIDEDSKVP